MQGWTAFVLVGLCLAVIHAHPHPRHHATTTTPPPFTPHSIRISNLAVDTHEDIVIDTNFPTFSWQSTSQHAYRIRVYEHVSHIRQHYQCPHETHTALHDTGIVKSAQSLHIVYEGPVLKPVHSYIASIQYWNEQSVESSSACVRFRTSLLDQWRYGQIPGNWSWIGSTHIPVNQLRREFSVSATAIKSAIVFMSGIGYSSLYLNGAPVDPNHRVLDPGWTTYEKRTLYVSFDITSKLNHGTNVMGVELGNGWYSQEQYQSGVLENKYGPPRLLLSLLITYADGSTSTIVSDESWLARSGPVLHDGIYMGTFYDARYERSGWNNINFHDQYSLWVNTSIVETPLNPEGIMSLQIMDPIRLAPYNLHTNKVDTTKHAPGIKKQHQLMGVPITQGVITPKRINAIQFTTSYDVGQNIAGWCSMKVKGRPGNMISIRYAEILAPNNKLNQDALYTENLRSAASTDVYVFKSNNEETIEPQFTQHGFRYLNFRGLTNDISSIQCHTVHSETTLTGHFTTSDPVIDQIHHNIQWGQMANLMSLPTDCPQRDERKGWMGDAGLTIDESLYNYDLHNFYLNYLNLMHDIQDSQGCLGDTTPFTWGQWPADNNWGTAYPQVVWYLYDHFGDTQVLQQHLSGVRGWIQCVQGAYEQTGLKNLRHHYGDWVPPPPYQQSNGALIASFPFLRDIQTLIRIAKVLNNTDIIQEYTTLYATLADEYHSTFWTNSTIGYADGMQTANVLSLALPDVVPDEYVDDVVQALVNDINEKGHVTTGIVGTAQLFPILTENDNYDLALKLLQLTTYPSYGYMFNNPTENATTLWELWDSDKPAEGPQMDSRNHIMFGAVGAYFYRYMAGISLSGLGVSSALSSSHPLIPSSSITIHPRMSYDYKLMSSLHTQLDTYHGLIMIEYQRDMDHIVNMHVQTPTLTTLILQRSIRKPTCAHIMLHTSTGIITLYDTAAQAWEQTICDHKQCISRSQITHVTGMSYVWMTTSSLNERDVIQHLSLQVTSGTYKMDVKWM